MKIWAYICVVMLCAICLFIGYVHVDGKGVDRGQRQMFLVWKMGCAQGMTVHLEGVGLVHCGLVKKPDLKR